VGKKESAERQVLIAPEKRDNEYNEDNVWRRKPELKRDEVGVDKTNNPKNSRE